MVTSGIEAYPLAWPEGWKRTDRGSRRTSGYKVSFGRARDEVVHSLKLMRVPDYNIIISSNIPTRRDGLPYSTFAEPADPGIAVYWTDRKHARRVIACDAWRTTRENIRAVGMTIEALRQLERTKASEILGRAFTGFAALPPSGDDWRTVLGFNDMRVTVEDVEARYRELSKEAHPDKGGSHDAMVKLNKAREAALKYLWIG